MAGLKRAYREGGSPKMVAQEAEIAELGKQLSTWQGG